MIRDLMTMQGVIGLILGLVLYELYWRGRAVRPGG
jgi:hypothetical protein